METGLVGGHVLWWWHGNINRLSSITMGRKQEIVTWSIECKHISDKRRGGGEGKGRGGKVR